MQFAKTYVQAAASTVADATICAATQRAYLCHVKVCTTATSATAGSFTIETVAGTVLHKVDVTGVSHINTFEAFGLPLRSENGLKLNADGTLATATITIGYVG
jgi:hypothetical protein